MTSCAPRRLTFWMFCAPQTATTFTPEARASWTASAPTEPEPPQMRTDWFEGVELGVSEG